MSNFIQFNILENQIAEVRLCRADKRNALSFAMLKELLVLGKKLRKRKDLRAVLITGEDSCFCAGIDLNDLRDPKNKLFALWSLLKPGTNLFQKVFLVWRDLPIPVIAVIEGPCFGAGMQLALGADFRIAAPNAQLSIMEAKWGLVADMGASVTLRGLVGLDVAKELAMTAKVLSGTEAKELGLVSYVADKPKERALQLASELSARSPEAVLAAKRVFQAMVTSGPSCNLKLERRWQLRLLRSKNFIVSQKRAKQPDLAFGERQFD